MADLTTTPSGVWVLQSLLGIESMPISMRLRPYIPSVDAGPTVVTLAGERPLTETVEYASLVAAGVIDEHGRVDEAVRDWMAVIGRPDREVVVAIRSPAAADAGVPGGGFVQERTMSVCMRDRWLASIARFGDEVVVAPVGETPHREHQVALVSEAVIHAFGPGAPAPIDGINLPTDALQHALTETYNQDPRIVATALARLGLSPDQIAVVAAAIRMDTSAMGVVTVIDHGITDHVHPTVLTVVDTEHGRVTVTYTAGADGSRWTSIWPTSAAGLRDDLAKIIGAPRLVR
ncbi:ESX secretion-associated protein EspG [Mycobacterium sp. MYCO198283]|uniref:ESX secretion-associated protein EspG n=1 Tax=Mycobacterium sp. MYCO198283 TaxID=2883505 RepID=UPI001E368DC8|nr:ESX secretion-associated protein EspG [Mycobacterium sp. MYCO198283]MCG5433048.1 ESX secretion-associated protein EspG [Mycobacterium sp. MYCO198283]